MAGGVRFELTVGVDPTSVFKTGALNRSATHPQLICIFSKEITLWQVNLNVHHSKIEMFIEKSCA
jgi:hypothetical protein